MSRWRAFSLHLAISALVCAGLLLVILNIWFPGILASIDGGWSGLAMVTGVDVVLGPLLTLVVFRAGKPGLRFDMSCIVTAQLACLVTGVWVVYGQRPLALVYAFDTFYSVTAKEFRDYDKDVSVLKSIPGPSPKLVLVQLPEDQAEAGLLLMRSQFMGNPLFIQTELFVALPQPAAPSLTRVTGLRDRAVAELGFEPVEFSQASCLAAGFVSGNGSGFVCFDDEKREISRYFAK